MSGNLPMIVFPVRVTAESLSQKFQIEGVRAQNNL